MLVVEADKKIGVVVMKADGKPLLSYRKGNDFGCVVSLIPQCLPAISILGKNSGLGKGTVLPSLFLRN